MFTGFKVPPRAVRLVVAACGASATSEKTRPWIFGACILWILSILLKNGRPLPRNVSNSRNCIQKSAFGNLPAVLPVLPVPAVPPEVVSASAAQTPLPHAPGVRMTGVQQTPSNKGFETVAGNI